MPEHADWGRTRTGRHYVRQLEDAVAALWDEMPIEQVKLLARETPGMVAFIHGLHDHMEHEQKMVRRNVWAPHIDGSGS